MSLGERHWHTRDECFKCGVCEMSLMGAKMCLRHGVPLCSSACAAQLEHRSNSSGFSDLNSNGLRLSDLKSNGLRSSDFNNKGSRSSDHSNNGSRSSDHGSNGPRSIDLINNGLMSMDLSRKPSPSPSVISYSTIV